MSEKKIVIQGKEIDCSKLSDELLIKLYQEIQERKVKMYESLAKLHEELNLLEEYNA